MKRVLSILLIITYIFSKTPDAFAKNGMVVSSNRLASEVGVQILKDGGNAIDAAIATGFALAVVHPGAGNIGGGGFMVIKLANGLVTTIDFREVAPSLAFRDMFLDENGNIIDGKSWNTSQASGVPGSVAGFGMASEKFGILDWNKLVEPATKLAEEGFKLNNDLVQTLNHPQWKLFFSRDPETKKIFFKSDQFQINENFIQSDLAKTLNRISLIGWQEFYNGETANLIEKCMNRTGGIITKSDLKNYKAKERNAIEINYRDYLIYSMPPASSGGIAIAGILNQLENINFSDISYHSAEHIHYVSEAERRVYADRAQFLGDTDFISVPIEELCSKEYADKRWKTINSRKASKSSSIKHGDLPIYHESEETTHYSVLDKWGNAVSVTTTINGWFGNGIVVDGAGFLLNNEMDDFSSKPGTPNTYGLIGNSANAISPNKRMLSSMSPTIILNPKSDMLLIVGSPGGSTIITTTVQVIMNVIDFKMNIEDAVESPRFHHQWLPDKIQFESISSSNNIVSEFSLETIKKLKKMGHKISFRRSIGEANCILKEDSIIMGSADSRRNSSAIGY
tara:strand:- start:1405 stop:3105 length:1701 start_codon:yes stop_codon:yes gene_type:complete